MLTHEGMIFIETFVPVEVDCKISIYFMHFLVGVSA
jgi:hypothetical protein